MLCPRCGHLLENYVMLEGGWCPRCEEWWPADITDKYDEEAES